MSNEEENLSELQKEIFVKICKNKTEELKAILATNKIKIDFVDSKENCTTPLQHASYNGYKEIVQMLLDHGANPNECPHKSGYTALHFAALSGNAEVCYLLMSHGAKIGARNEVNRTPAQMAAFVGNHNCVAIINNFISKSEIDYFIKPQGLQKEPMLHPHLADSFHSFIMQVNIHPVRVVMNLQKYPGLLDYLPMIQKVLETMCQREMTKGAETNEVMVFKFHYLSCIIAEVIKCQKRQNVMKADKNDKEKKNEEKIEEKKSDVIELLIKKFLKTKSDGKPEYLELFLRETVREFNYRDSAIFHQMIAILANSDPPSAMSVIYAAINGQRAFDDNIQVCVTCMEDKASKKCSKCKMVQYCDRECQRLHWFLHKKTCNRLNQSTNTKANSEKLTQ